MRIELTKRQKEELAPLYRRLPLEPGAPHHGVLLAQVYDHDMVVKYVEADLADELIRRVYEKADRVHDE